MSLLAVELSLEQCEEFYKRCGERKAETLDQKNAILLEMIKEGNVIRATSTNRTKEEYIKDTAEHRGNVLEIKPKEGEDNAKI